MIREVLAITALLWGVNISAYAAPVSSDDRISHFQALPSESLEQAVANLASHNQELKALVEKPELTNEDMVKIHELTYTLENALERLREDLESTADVLEEVHLGSETMDRNRVRDNAERYLEVMQTLFQ